MNTSKFSFLRLRIRYLVLFMVVTFTITCFVSPTVVHAVVACHGVGTSDIRRPSGNVFIDYQGHDTCANVVLFMEDRVSVIDKNSNTVSTDDRVCSNCRDVYVPNSSQKDLYIGTTGQTYTVQEDTRHQETSGGQVYVGRHIIAVYRT